MFLGESRLKKKGGGGCGTSKSNRWGIHCDR